MCFYVFSCIIFVFLKKRWRKDFLLLSGAPQAPPAQPPARRSCAEGEAAPKANRAVGEAQLSEAKLSEAKLSLRSGLVGGADQST